MSIRVTLTRPTRGPTRNRSAASDCDGTDLLLFIGTADLDLLIGGRPADAIAIANNIAPEKNESYPPPRKERHNGNGPTPNSLKSWSWGSTIRLVLDSRGIPTQIGRRGSRSGNGGKGVPKNINGVRLFVRGMNPFGGGRWWVWLWCGGCRASSRRGGGEGVPLYKRCVLLSVCRL